MKYATLKSVYQRIILSAVMVLIVSATIPIFNNKSGETNKMSAIGTFLQDPLGINRQKPVSGLSPAQNTVYQSSGVLPAAYYPQPAPTPTAPAPTNTRTAYPDFESPGTPPPAPVTYTDVLGRTYGDQAAANAATAEVNRLREGFNTQKGNIYGTSLDAARTGGNELKSSILDFVDSARTAQSGLDNRAINNELNRNRGTAGVYGMVGRGIKSGGVMLNNKNSGDSSAAEGIARAYGDLGRRELSTVGNQYEMENRGIGMEQENLGRQISGFRDRKYGESKNRVVEGIVTDARNKLAALDAAMMDASLPDRIQIEAEKEAIKGQVLGELSQYDQMLRDQTAAVAPTSQEARRAEAMRLAQLGTAPENAFDFTSEMPTQFQNTGPFAGDLPLFTFPRGSRRTA